ncbi:hypothetical protein D0B88_16115 [Cellvibrio sp. KY-YJ-3]|nr:hypothetical protein D0B88_16115 [Cellvibrio sp. KY-YJ-3]
MQVHGATIVLREKQLLSHAHLYLYIFDIHSICTDIHRQQARKEKREKRKEKREKRKEKRVFQEGK